MPWYDSEWFETIYQLSLIFGFIFLVWNSFTNHGIRKINAAQKDLNLIPAMMFYFRTSNKDEPDNPEYLKFRIRNLGNNVATSIYIPPVIFKEGDTEFEFKFALSDVNNTLKANEERDIKLECYTNGVSQYHSRNSNFYAYFNPNNLMDVEVFRESGLIAPTTASKRNIAVYFRDIRGQAYKTTLGFSPRGIQIDQPSLRL